MKTNESLPDVVFDHFDAARIRQLIRDVAIHYGVSTCFLAVEAPTNLQLKARHGVELRTVPHTSIARHWVNRDLPIIIADALADSRFCEDQLVRGPPPRRFYTSAPLMLGKCKCVGSLCIMDAEPREAFGLCDCEVLTRTTRAIVEIYTVTTKSQDLWSLTLDSLASPMAEDAEEDESKSDLSASGGVKTNESLPDLATHQFDGARIRQLVADVAAHYRVSTCFLAMQTPKHMKLTALYGLEQRTVPLNSIARHWVNRDLPIIIGDALADTRFVDDELVCGPPLRRFYTGAPLMLRPYKCVGSLCIMDQVPRQNFGLGECDMLVRTAKAIIEVYMLSAKSQDLWTLTVDSLEPLQLAPASHSEQEAAPHHVREAESKVSARPA